MMEGTKREKHNCTFGFKEVKYISKMVAFFFIIESLHFIFVICVVEHLNIFTVYIVETYLNRCSNTQKEEDYTFWPIDEWEIMTILSF